MKYSEELIEKVRESTDIVELIGQYVQLQKSGSKFKGLCPLPGHAEKTPSFNVDPLKQFFFCYGCQKGGDVFNFLKIVKGFNFPESIQELATRARISLPQEQSDDEDFNEKQNRRKLFLRVNKWAQEFYHRQLLAKPKTHPVWEYIRERKISDQSVEEFSIGFADDDWDLLIRGMQKSKVPVEIAMELGLIKLAENNSQFDTFRNRLMFPIVDAKGDTLGFGGRAIGDVQPKYLNSSDSPVFHKGKTLYGLNLTAKNIRASNEAFIVEGYMDALMLYQFGVTNVVATLGTALTPDHARLIRKFCEKVISLFDGDSAGIQAAKKSLPVLLEGGLISRQMELPEKMDPDEFLIAHGLEKFKKKALDAPDHLMNFFSTLVKSFQGQPGQKLEILNQVTPLLTKASNPKLRQIYIKEISEALQMDIKWIDAESRPAKSQPIKITQENKPVSPRLIPKEEILILSYGLTKPEYFRVISEGAIIDQIETPEIREILEKLNEIYCKNPGHFDRLATSLMNEAITAQIIDPKVLLESEKSELDDSAINQLIVDCLQRVKNRQLSKKSQSLLQHLRAQTHTDSENLENFMKIAKEQKGNL